MSGSRALSVLGLEPGATLQDVKRAYARLIRIHRPESDPAGFQRVHEAYEEAVRLTRQRRRQASRESVERDQGPPIDEGIASAATMRFTPSSETRLSGSRETDPDAAAASDPAPPTATEPEGEPTRAVSDSPRSREQVVEAARRGEPLVRAELQLLSEALHELDEPIPAAVLLRQPWRPRDGSPFALQVESLLLRGAWDQVIAQVTDPALEAARLQDDSLEHWCGRVAACLAWVRPEAAKALVARLPLGLPRSIEDALVASSHYGEAWGALSEKFFPLREFERLFITQALSASVFRPLALGAYERAISDSATRAALVAFLTRDTKGHSKFAEGFLLPWVETFCDEHAGRETDVGAGTVAPHRLLRDELGEARRARQEPQREPSGAASGEDEPSSSSGKSGEQATPESRPKRLEGGPKGSEALPHGHWMQLLCVAVFAGAAIFGEGNRGRTGFSLVLLLLALLVTLPRIGNGPRSEGVRWMLQWACQLLIGLELVRHFLPPSDWIWLLKVGTHPHVLLDAHGELLVTQDEDVAQRSRDGGARWEQVTLPRLAVGGFLRDQTTDSWWLCSDDGAAVSSFDASAGSWRTSRPAPEKIHYAPAIHGGRVVAASETSLMVLPAFDGSWERLDVVSSVRDFASFEDRIIVAASKPVQSDDGGRTWKSLAAYGIEEVGIGPERIYGFQKPTGTSPVELVTDLVGVGHAPRIVHLHEAATAGANATSYDAPCIPEDVAVNPKHDEQLLIACDGAGVYYSGDEGRAWIDLDMQKRDVHSLAADFERRRVYAAVRAGGFRNGALFVRSF